MARNDNTYSTYVSWMKVALPILALVLLSTLFLFSGRPGGGPEIPYSDVEIAELSKREQVGAPDYSGMTEDGAALRFTAASMAPRAEDPETLAGQALTGRIETADGATIDLRSDSGEIDLRDSLAELSGAVEIVTSTGYRAETATLIADLEEAHLESAGEVFADGPPGKLTAGKMELTRETEGAGRYVLVFKDGVNLIYEPVD